MTYKINMVLEAPSTMQKIEIGTLLKRERVHTYTYKSTKIEHPVKSLGGFTTVIKATSPL